MNAMLSEGYRSPVVATLIFSFAAVVLSLLVAGRPGSMRKTGVVILPMALLAILVDIEHGHAIFMLAALIAAAGEALLVQERVAGYVTGLGLFLAARVVYSTSFVVASVPALLTGHPWRLAVVVLAMIVVIYAMRRFWPHAGPLKWASLIYAVLLVVMIVLAATVPPPAVLIGTVVMAGSDLAISAARFLLPSDEAEPAWVAGSTFLARYVGQALIVLAAVNLI